MSELFNSLTIPFLLAMFLAVNMGGSGTAPAFSAAYGASVIRRSLIPGLFGIMVLAGALLAGKEVSLTLGKGLLDAAFFTPEATSLILLSISLSLLIANLLGVPQSTSQSTVLAIAGAASAMEVFDSHKLFYVILPTWLILPVVAFGLMLVLSKWVLPMAQKKIFTSDYKQLSTHPLLKGLLIFSSLYVAFSIGANNVANAAAPIASLTANEIGKEAIENFLPIIILSVLIVAPCFAIGSSLMGHKVTKATGKGIVEPTPFHATVIALIVASLLMYASIMQGIPTSLVQLNGAAFIALSISKDGAKTTFQKPTVRKFFLVWAVAPVFAFLVAYVLTLVFLV
ncbi:inorganic phosphate transporter [Echinicola vietnamensis]|uniref:Phosphate/sulfate permease n=1 Tax=Echinicola vietnamensis (strain DSM 17526 / LMG 23754 / KMM 6221) TaxID=926556 RepID=L0G326_ECHVK|nr:inorganic phosphate transporter [Echinicola vietnamensis]AGA79708.1 phosphate/sulfate permease [Echinicola vietnamensis DSM 17526]